MIDGVASGIAVCSLVLSHSLPTNADDRTAEFRRPELVAIMWAPEEGIQFRKPPSVAWRSDGTLLPAEELKWLFDSGNLQVFQVSADRSTERPLVVVFRADERAQRPHQLATTLVIDDVPQARHGPVFDYSTTGSTKDHFFAARISPPPSAKWPADITLDVRTQVSEPTVLHVLDGARARECTPEKPLMVDEGVRWKIGPSVFGHDDSEESFGLLSVDQNVADPMCGWSEEVTLENGTRLRVSRVMQFHRVLEYGCRLDKRSPIARVELLRRRFRVERYEQVPTHPEFLSN